MKRRSFLKGLLGTTAVVAVPSLAKIGGDSSNVDVESILEARKAMDAMPILHDENKNLIREMYYYKSVYKQYQLRLDIKTKTQGFYAEMLLTLDEYKDKDKLQLVKQGGYDLLFDIMKANKIKKSDLILMPMPNGYVKPV